MDRYFAYGSNMNPMRVHERGLRVLRAEAALLPGFELRFEKHSRVHAGCGHASISYSPGAVVEGVLYWLASETEILKMDPFEHAPVNYSRDVVEVQTAAGAVASWTYFANAAVLRPGLRPPRAYLNHLLAGREYLSPAYFQRLHAWECVEPR